MRFTDLNKSSETLRKLAAQRQLEKAAFMYGQGFQIEKIAAVTGMDKEAILPALARAVPSLIKGLGNIGGKAISATARAPGRMATAPARMAGKGLLGWAKKKPLTAGFAALTVADAAGQGRKAYRAQREAQMAQRQYGQMRNAMRRARKISPAHDIAPMSGF